MYMESTLEIWPVGIRLIWVPSIRVPCARHKVRRTKNSKHNNMQQAPSTREMRTGDVMPHDSYAPTARETKYVIVYQVLVVHRTPEKKIRDFKT